MNLLQDPIYFSRILFKNRDKIAIEYGLILAYRNSKEKHTNLFKEIKYILNFLIDKGVDVDKIISKDKSIIAPPYRIYYDKNKKLFLPLFFVPSLFSEGVDYLKEIFYY